MEKMLYAVTAVIFLDGAVRKRCLNVQGVDVDWSGMSDLISRQKAIDAVFELSEKLSDEMLFIDAIVDEIENIPSAEPEQKWIPVSEELPKEYIDVLLQFPHTMAVGYQEDGFWNIITCDDFYSGLDEKDEKPIAWMPLPEAWRGE